MTFHFQRAFVCSVYRIDSGYRPEKYWLKDLMGEKLPRSFYAAELKQVPKPARKDYFVPEKIRKREIRDGKVWCLVQYIGKD